MAKQLCPVCNETKLGFLNSENIIDGKICENCIKKIGLKFSSTSNDEIFKLENITIQKVKNMIETNEKFNFEDEKAKVKQSKLDAKAQKNNDKEKSQQIYEEKLNKIQEQMNNAGVSDLFGTSKEVKELPNILKNSETIIYATSGFYDGNTVLIVITNSRLVFIDKGMIYGTDFREIPFDKINSVNYSSKLMFADISIENGMNSTNIQNVDKKTAPIFVDKLKNAISKLEQPLINNSNSTFSLADELKKLAELKATGILTQDEFDEQKQKLLNK